MELLLATSNVHKARAIQALLGHPVQHINLDLPEIQALSVAEVIEAKARSAYALVGRPVLVEDTSLAMHAWNGLPGALIRWFLETVGTQGICTMLAGAADRGATAETGLGFFDGEHFVAYSGVLDGQIALAPRGQGGFGWDTIFIPNGLEQTLAELTPEAYTAISMRTVALAQLRNYLDHHPSRPTE